MKKVLIFTFLTANLFFLNACSSGGNSENTVVDKISPNSNAQNPNANRIENGIGAPTPITNIDAVNTSQSNNPINTDKRKLVNSNSTEKPKISYVPGPYNSQVGSTMSDSGEFIQIRIFNSDAQIQKMEKNVNTGNSKIYLKNGKVVFAPPNKQFDFINASPQDILIAVGVMQKPDDSQTGAK